jgi:hypothetical protein
MTPTKMQPPDLTPLMRDDVALVKRLTKDWPRSHRLALARILDAAKHSDRVLTMIARYEGETKAKRT